MLHPYRKAIITVRKSFLLQAFCPSREVKQIFVTGKGKVFV